MTADDDISDLEDPDTQSSEDGGEGPMDASEGLNELAPNDEENIGSFVAPLLPAPAEQIGEAPVVE